MKDTIAYIETEKRTYPFVFNLNVMEAIQEEYGTLDNWGDLTNGEAYAKKAYEATGNKKPWESLSEKEKSKYVGEPDIKALIFGYTAMINEGIDSENEETGTDIKPLTRKQVGRIITEVGVVDATRKLNKTVVESSQSTEKNE